MKYFIAAAKPLLLDSLGLIVFAILFALKAGVVIAAGVSASITVAMIGFEIYRKKPVAALQWISLGLVIVSMAATWFTRDPRFVMVKGTVIYAIVGAAMLQKGWMTRYVPPFVLAETGDAVTIFGYLWAALMFVTAAANMGIAVFFPGLWVAFIGIFPLASKIALFLVQYLTLRDRIVRKRRRAAASIPPFSNRPDAASK